MDVAAQPVELGDYDRRLVLTGGLEGRGQLGPPIGGVLRGRTRPERAPGSRKGTRFMASTTSTTCMASATSRSASKAPTWGPSFFALCVIALSSAGCSGLAAPTKDELLSRAKEEFTAGQYDKAEKDYREVLRL